MATAPLPADEAARLEALARYAVMDSLPEAAFDRLVGMAAQICHAPIALITLIDEERQWFKACLGLDLRQTDRGLSFCAHALATPELLVVPDARLDPRFRDNALVNGPPHIRFYAGAPLRTPEGHTLGSLCVIDPVPRPDLTPEQRALLGDLAALVMDELELRLGRQALQSEAEGERRLSAQLSRALQYAATLRGVTDLADLALPPGQLFQQSAALLGATLEVDWAGVIALRPDLAFSFSAWHAPHAAEFARAADTSLHPSDYPELWLLAGGSRAHFSEQRPARQPAPAVAQVQASAVVPLGYAGASRFALTVVSLSVHRWTSAERELIEGVGRELRRALQRQEQLSALREGRERLQLALNHAPLVLWSADLDGRFTLSEGHGLAALGLTPGAAVGRSVFELYADQPALTGYVRRALAGETVDAVLDLGERTFEARYQPLTDETGQVGVLGLGYDVTRLVQAERAAAQAQRQAEALLALSRLLQDTDSLDAAASAALRALQGVMALDILLLYRRDGDWLRPVAVSGAVPPGVHPSQAWAMPLELAQAHGVLAGQPAFLSGEQVPPAGRPFRIAGAAVLPVALDDPARAVLLGAYRLHQARPWLPEEREVLAAAARSLASSVARERRVERLQLAAFSDPLTGLGNRRAFDADLASELARAERHGHGVGVLSIDLDGLKLINDRLGHAHGDALLRTFAQSLRLCLRQEDRVFRLGGDEYAAILPHLAPAGVPQVLGRVQSAVATLRAAGFPDGAASAGLACFPTDARLPTDLVQLADARMYAAKQTRRPAHPT